LSLPPWGKARMGVEMDIKKYFDFEFKNCYMNCEELHSYRDLQKHMPTLTPFATAQGRLTATH